MTKVFNTTVSVKEGASRSVLRGIIQYDTLNEVNVRITDGSKAFDYSDYTNIVFKVLKADGTSYIAAEGDRVIATSPRDGIVTVILADQATTVAGLCQSVIEIYEGESRMTTARLNYEVFESLGVDEAAQSESHYPVFQTLLADLSALEANVESAEDKRATAEAARASAASGYVARAEQAAADAEMWARAAQDIAEGDYATRAELEAVEAGAAPAGFGLGSAFGKLAPTQNGVEYNADACTKHGWWYARSNTPFGSWTPIHVMAYGENDVYQEAHGARTASGVPNSVTARRVMQDGSWFPWEYVNPPMHIGVEYRTTERHLGRPVYAKLISAGALPNNGIKTVDVTDNVTDIRYLISVTGVDLTTGQVLPSGAFGGDSSRQVLVGGNRSGITIQTNFNGSSAASVYLTVKYTKTTD